MSDEDADERAGTTGAEGPTDWSPRIPTTSPDAAPGPATLLAVLVGNIGTGLLISCLLGVTATIAVLDGGDLLAGLREVPATVTAVEETLTRGNRITIETVDGDTELVRAYGPQRHGLRTGRPLTVWLGGFSGRDLLVEARVEGGVRFGPGLPSPIWVIACSVIALLAAGMLALFHRGHLLFVVTFTLLTIAVWSSMTLRN
ncbi:hypothetical protein [Pseudonocardia lacus]|uniref:hypothetical protein n=1 Tax=Pseudonocardia lacus TaxID=2835865 RepID=UPI001BDC49E4|nr:hypothetical protein [Pseudonocardia lacus]